MTDSLKLKDGDYTLADSGLWIEVGPFALRILRTDEGVVVDVYGNGREDECSIASCYAFDTEVESAASTRPYNQLWPWCLTCHSYHHPDNKTCKAKEK